MKKERDDHAPLYTAIPIEYLMCNVHRITDGVR
jgi:hypothetical protein